MDYASRGTCPSRSRRRFERYHDFPWGFGTVEQDGEPQVVLSAKKLAQLEIYVISTSLSDLDESMREWLSRTHGLLKWCSTPPMRGR